MSATNNMLISVDFVKYTVATVFGYAKPSFLAKFDFALHFGSNRYVLTEIDYICKINKNNIIMNMFYEKLLNDIKLGQNIDIVWNDYVNENIRKCQEKSLHIV